MHRPRHLAVSGRRSEGGVYFIPTRRRAVHGVQIYTGVYECVPTYRLTAVANEDPTHSFPVVHVVAAVMEDVDTDLITLIHDRPVIWDKSLEIYKSRSETTAAWRQICAELNPEFESLCEDSKNKYGKILSVKWTNIRDRYTKYLKKLAEEKTTGSKAKSTRKYVFADQLSFLQKNTNRRETVCSTVFGEGRETPSTPIENEGLVQEERTPSPSVTQEETAHHPVKGKSTRKRQAPGLTEIEKSIFTSLMTGTQAFFKGILPTLQKFDDNATVQFQAGVLSLIQDNQSSRVPERPQWHAYEERYHQPSSS